MTTLTQPVHSASALRVARGDRTSMIGGLGFALVVVVMAAWVPFHFSLGTLTNLVGLFSLIILGTTWNLLAGYGGLVSIGQQAFIGAGGYAVIKLADAAGLPIVLAVLLAGVVCGILAFPTSFLLFRLVGGYLAIGTWVVAEVFKLVTTQIDALGAGSGLSLMAFREDGTSRIARIGTVYWLALAIAVLVVLATYVLMRSRLGLGLTAIRDNPTAAGSLGVAVQRSRRIVYVAASAGAGLAGALIATSSLRVTPDSIYSVNYTAYMIFIVVIGGIGTIEGPILGAIVFYVLQQELAQHGTWYLVVLGAVAIAVVLVAPKGLWGLLSREGRLEVFPVGHRVTPPR
ncbi:branched-chain amino acid ABC transporter permease [Nocardioides sp. DS6]|uniref:Branched-chain amino acid ABC transporter permease n=1 Tax=Nocardioides eburneus TaxID=3231482 RepID=A0ABV3T020_9ACTN